MREGSIFVSLRRHHHPRPQMSTSMGFVGAGIVLVSILLFLVHCGAVHAYVVLHPTDPQPTSLDPINGPFDFRLAPGTFIWNATTLIPSNIQNSTITASSTFSFSALDPAHPPVITCPDFVILPPLDANSNPVIAALIHVSPNSKLNISHISVFNCGQLLYAEHDTLVMIDNLDASQLGLNFILTYGNDAVININYSTFRDTNFTVGPDLSSYAQINLLGGSLIVANSIAYNITTSGLIFAKYCATTSFSNYTAKDIYSYFGCSHWFNDVAEVDFINSAIIRNIAPVLYQFSGAGLWIETTQLNVTASIKNTQFIGNQNMDPYYGLGSGIVIAQNGYLNVYPIVSIDNSTFVDNMAFFEGAALYIFGSVVTVNNSYISDNGVIFPEACSTICMGFDNSYGPMTIMNTIISGNYGAQVISVEYGIMIWSNVSFIDNISSASIALMIMVYSQMEIYDSLIANNTGDRLFLIETGSIEVKSSRFNRNYPYNPASKSGALLSFTGQTDVLISNNFFLNHQDFMSIISISITSTAQIIGNYFFNNSAQNCAGIGVSQATFLDIYNNSIIASSCTSDPRVLTDLGPCAAVCLGLSISSMQISDLNIEQLAATGIVVNIEQNITMNSIHIRNALSAFYLTGRVGLLQISNSTFNGLYSPYDSISSLVQFLPNSAIVFVAFDNISVTDSQATMICISGPGNILISNSAFTNTGTILVGSGTSKSTLTNVSTSNTIATSPLSTDSSKYSGAILSLSAQASASIMGGSFNSGAGQEGAFATVRETASLSISGGATISYFSSTLSSDGGAIWVDAQANLSISNVTFIGNKAPNGDGGAVFFSSGAENGATFRDNIHFVNNSAVYGGAIFFQGQVQTQLSSISFTKNTAAIGDNFLTGAAAIVPSSYFDPSTFSSQQNQVWNITTSMSGAVVNNASVMLVDSFGQFLSRGDIFFYLIVQSLSSSPLSSSNALNCSSKQFMLSGITHELVSNGVANFSTLRAHGCAGSYPIVITTDDIFLQFPSSQFRINATITIPGCPAGYFLQNPSLNGLTSSDEFLKCTTCPLGTFTTQVDTLGACMIPAAGMYSADSITVTACDDHGYELGLCPPREILSVPALATIVVVSLVLFAGGLVAIMRLRKNAKDKVRMLGGFIDASEVVLGEQLGAGTYGVVHAGIFRGTNVAVKKLHDYFFTESLSGSKSSGSSGEGSDGKVYPSVNEVTKNESIESRIHRTIEKSMISKKSTDKSGKGSEKSSSGDENKVDVKGLLKSMDQEVRLLSSLRHPNIVMYLAACLDKPTVILVMERLALGPLNDILRNTDVKLTYKQRLQMAVDGFSGMVYLHTNNPIMLHCDLKTANMLVAADLTVKVSDFGLTHLAKNKKYSLNGSRVGTLLWMAPEVLEGIAYTTASDVYSMAIVLWEIIYRKRPFEGTKLPDSEEAFIAAIVELHLRPKITKGLEPKLTEALERGWQYSTQGRPSMDEMRGLIVAAMNDIAKREAKTSQNQKNKISSKSATVSEANSKAKEIEVNSSGLRSDAKIVRTGFMSETSDDGKNPQAILTSPNSKPAHSLPPVERKPAMEVLEIKSFGPGSH